MVKQNIDIMRANKKIITKDNFKTKKIKIVRCKVCREKIGMEKSKDRNDRALKLFKKDQKIKIVCKNCGSVNE